MKEFLAFIGAWYLISLFHLFVVGIIFRHNIKFIIEKNQGATDGRG